MVKSSHIYALIFAGMLAVFIVTLHLMGRISVCTCGFGFWAGAWDNTTSQNIADPYSFSHLLHGLIFFWVLWLFRRKLPVGVRFLIAILVEMGWEILENTPLIIERYRAATASLDYFGDSIMNSVFDVLFTVFGFWLASRLPWKWSIGIFVIVEIALLFLIRDNLTLNVLMLIYPVQAIRQWQMIGH